METFILEISVPDGGDNAGNANHQNKGTDICRLCLNLTELQSISDIKFSKRHNNFGFLETQLNFQLPEEVCGDCWQKLNEILSFIKKCRESHLIYTQMQKNCSSIKKEELVPKVEIESDTDGDLCDSQVEIKEDDSKDFIRTFDDSSLENTKIELKEEEKISVVIKKSVKSKYVKKQESEVCPTCGGKTTSSLAAHYKVSPKCYPKDYKCTICNSSFANRYKLNMHEQTKHGNITVMCHICSKIMNPASLRRHVREHDSGKIYMCELCGSSFTRLENLIKHRESHDRKKRVKFVPKPRSEDPRRFSCKYCSKPFQFRHKFINHLKTHTEKDPDDKVVVKPGDLTCPVCKKEFAHLRPLKLHIVSHERKRARLCLRCQDFFYSALSYKKHMSTAHNIERKFSCSKCPKKFETQSSLDIHSLTHQDPQFSCTLCNKKFRLRGHLTRHLAVVHDVNKGEPYKCNVCSRAFSMKENLRIHERIHTGERPYVCHVCNKSFSASNTRKAHVRRAHGEEEVEKIKTFEP